MTTTAANDLRDSAGVTAWRRAPVVRHEVAVPSATLHSWGCTCSSCVRQELFLAGLRAMSTLGDDAVAIRGNSHSPD